jgi:hypothetical protein
MPSRMSDAAIANDRDPKGRFQTGNIGGGRKPGSRNRLGEQFIADLADAWQKHGAAALEACAIEEPSQFCRIIASLLPKQAELSVDIDIMHDVTSKLEAFRTLSAMLGADPAAGLRRLKRIAPQIEHER